MLSDEEEEDKGEESVSFVQGAGSGEGSSFEAELAKAPEEEREIIRRGRERAKELQELQHSAGWKFVKEKNAT